MRVFVVVTTGSRTWTNRPAVLAAIEQLKHDEPYLLVVQGGAPGADAIVEQVCRDLGVHCARIEAQWLWLGRRAGPARNRIMLDLAPDWVIAFRSAGESPGTDDTIAAARKRQIPVMTVHDSGRIDRYPVVGIQEEL